jgi:hypothetical protein
MAQNRTRRTVLRTMGAVGATTASAGLSGCLALLVGRSQTGGGTPISFASQRKRIRRSDATIVVHTRAELIEALQTPNAVIWVPGNVTIEMGGATMVPIANNVTIASNRNLGGKKGGMIKTSEYPNVGVFITENDDVSFRVTGLRLKGPRTDYFDPVAFGRDTYDYAVTGFRPYGKSVVVDNCEVFGWTAAGFIPGTKETPTQGWFHHNAMHHNQMAHLGYGMDLQNGVHLVEWNYFDANRHSIAGFGHRENGYEARFNVVGTHVDHPSFFQFDMHSLGENIESGPMSDSQMAGRYVNAHHNVFELTDHNALSLSGIPRMYARFCRNWCADNQNVVDSDPGADLRVKHNRYGPQQVKHGRAWLKQLAHALSQRSSSSSSSSPSPFGTRPSPTPLNPPLSIRSPPSLDSTSTATSLPTPTNTSTMTARSNTSSTAQASHVNPITGIPLTPVEDR